MANSKIISELKSKVTKDIINNDEIVKAIDCPDMDKENWESIYLINSKETIDMGFTPVIFREHQNQNIITDAVTFITMEVNIPQTDKYSIYAYPILEIWVVSHNKHNRIDNIQGVKDNRNDYISILLDEMFNGKKAGYGDITLKSNTAGVYDDNFVYRRLVFEGIDINNSLCE